MKTSAENTAAAVGILILLATGCGLPGTQTAKGFRMPGGRAPSPAPPTAAAMPGPPSHSPIPGYPAASATPAFGRTSNGPSIAQVGYLAPDEAVGPRAAFSGTSGQLACGCQACLSDGRQSTLPYGYALPGGPVNAYATDAQEFICDGGDHPPAAVVRRDDSIGGLQPEDTIVHYTTEAGDIELQASNRVCLYAPRFSSVRKITGAVAGGHAVGLAGFDRPLGTNRVQVNEGGVVMSETVELGHADVARRIDAMRERMRGVPVENVLQLEQATDVLAALVGLSMDQLNELRDEDKALLEQLARAAVAWTIDESVEVAIEDLKAPTLTRDESLEGFTIYDFPDAGQLQIGKLADRTDAKPGEIVSFVIHVKNVGDSAVDHVVLTDNLTTRLEYVEDSQTSSGGAEFEAIANEGQSLRLLWKLTDKLRVGESFTIRFQCKVR